MNGPADLTGKKFGRLTALNLCEKFSDGKTAWLCKCSCGNYKRVRATHLMAGMVQSCGCLRKEGPHTTHGHSKNSRIYRIWSNMKSRCYNPNASEYSRYGGRGIRICDEWRNDFQVFYDWAMSQGYANNLSIDRKDTNGNYEPGNCQWATSRQQANNTSGNFQVLFDNKIITVAEVARKLNVSPFALYKKIKRRNISKEDATKTDIAILLHLEVNKCSA